MPSVDIALVSDGQRLREISEAQVASLMESIADIGLLNPITVYPSEIQDGAVAVDGFGLIAGAHRLEACRRLGLAEIPAHVVELGELERQIAECDENLCGTKLTPSEKALFTKRRKQAYEALHPETRHGENQHSRSCQIGDSTSAERFTADTAAKTGESERVVQRNAERGERISQEALEVIRGTDLDKGTYLDQIKKVPLSEQAKRARSDLKDQRSQTGIQRRIAPKVADEPLDDVDALEAQVRALMSAWNKASREAREEFFARIDRPVMDRGDDDLSVPGFLRRTG